MTRRVTPDVLAELMGAVKQESQLPIKPESNKESDTESTKAIGQTGNKAIKKASNKPNLTQLIIDGTEEPLAQEAGEIKEKATFNLPVKLLGELEDRCHEIRKMLGSKQVSKTLIVEEALKMAFVEFDLKKEGSKLYGRLASNKAIKQ